VDASRPASAGGVELLHQAALAASGLVLVDDTLGGGHVEALDGEAQGLGARSVPAALTAFFTRVFSSLFTALLRSAALALVRMRFFWLLMFAMWFVCPFGAGRPVTRVITGTASQGWMTAHR
jgi:hypothetical protein